MLSYWEVSRLGSTSRFWIWIIFKYRSNTKNKGKVFIKLAVLVKLGPRNKSDSLGEELIWILILVMDNYSYLSRC